MLFVRKLYAVDCQNKRLRRKRCSLNYRSFSVSQYQLLLPSLSVCWPGIHSQTRQWSQLCPRTVVRIADVRAIDNDDDDDDDSVEDIDDNRRRWRAAAVKSARCCASWVAAALATTWNSIAVTSSIKNCEPIASVTGRLIDSCYWVSL